MTGWKTLKQVTLKGKEEKLGASDLRVSEPLAKDYHVGEKGCWVGLGWVVNCIRPAKMITA